MPNTTKICRLCGEKNNPTFPTCWKCCASLSNIETKVLNEDEISSLVDNLHNAVDGIGKGLRIGEKYAKEWGEIAGQILKESGAFRSGVGNTNKANGKMSINEAYKILNISKKNSPEEIKKAYRQKVSEWHPDKLSTMAKELQNTATSEMKRINQAYEVLLLESSKDNPASSSQSEKTRAPWGNGSVEEGGQDKIFPVARSMMDETERVYKNHVVSLGRQPNDLGILYVRSYAASFVTHAAKLKLAESEPGVYSALIDKINTYSVHGLNLSQSKKEIDGLLMVSEYTIHQALDTELMAIGMGKLGPAQEVLAQHYKFILEQSTGPLDQLTQEERDKALPLETIFMSNVPGALSIWCKLLENL